MNTQMTARVSVALASPVSFRVICAQLLPQNSVTRRREEGLPLGSAPELHLLHLNGHLLLLLLR